MRPTFCALKGVILTYLLFIFVRIRPSDVHTCFTPYLIHAVLNKSYLIFIKFFG